jgi:HKD family nuclease
MATKEFILQGFTSRTHGAAIRELFDIPDIQKVIVSVAFITESGVELIDAQLKANSEKLTVFAGIRNEISSFQGLSKLLGYGGTLYAVDTGARRIIFHPKLYLVRGKAAARMVIGSSNLTYGGLNNNIEAGMMFHFDLATATDKQLVDTIEAQFADLPTEYQDNILKVTKAAQLEDWLKSGRLVDEMAVLPPRPNASADGSSGVGDTVPRIRLKVAALRRALKRAKAATKKPSVTTKTTKAVARPVSPTSGVNLELVWESKSLAKRDLQIPDSKGTHATGSINLDKGLLEADVNQRTYFREIVFSELSWNTRSVTVDEAFAKFHLIIKGLSYGEYDLAIRFTKTKVATYNQNNAVTRLSWGPVRTFIARPDLVGRTLALFRDKADPTRFVLEID